MAIEGATMNGLPDEEEDDATIMTFDTHIPRSARIAIAVFYTAAYEMAHLGPATAGIRCFLRKRQRGV